MAAGRGSSGVRRGGGLPGVQRPPGGPLLPAAAGTGVVSGGLLAAEAEYKRLNAELEAKSEKLVCQAEEVMKGQQELLTRPVSVQTKSGEDDRQRGPLYPEVSSLTHSHFKVANKKSASMPTAQNRPYSGSKGKRTTSSSDIRNVEVQNADDVAVWKDCIDFSLAKTISKIEEKLERDGLPDCLDDDIIPSIGNEIGAVGVPELERNCFGLHWKLTPNKFKKLRSDFLRQSYMLCRKSWIAWCVNAGKRNWRI